MKVDSPYWNWDLGVCTKHSLPMVPCPTCMAGDGDEDVEFRVEESDLNFLEGENHVRAMDARAEGNVDEDDNPVYERATVRELVPENFVNPTFV